MKKVIITLFAVLSVLSLNAKTIIKNDNTGNKLTETAGIYSIKGKHGAVLLGNKDNAIKILSAAEKSFMKDNLNKVIKYGDDKEDNFELLEDEEGFYLVKFGFGAVKIRESDIMKFGAALGVKKTGDGVKKAGDGAKKFGDGVKKLWSAAKSTTNTIFKEIKK